MHICDILSNRKTPTISFEFFPPNTTEGRDRLQDTIQKLAEFEPDFVSITYGAGGSTRQATRQVVEHIQHGTRLRPIPHFTCVNHQKDELDAILSDYAMLGVSNILALRGDAPRHSPNHDHRSDHCVHASDLVRHIRQFNERGLHPEARGFGIGVAGFPEGHPATPNRLLEMDYLKAKVDAGADYICTQLFFDNRDFFDFVERCDIAGIRIPIFAGILPLTSFVTMRRMAELAGGARVPAKLLRGLLSAENDAQAVQEIGLQHATEQCAELVANSIAGIHLYTLNQADPVSRILRNLRPA